MACGEFSLIARYFDRVRSSRLDVELGIGDDCACMGGYGVNSNVTTRFQKRKV